MIPAAGSGDISFCASLFFLVQHTFYDDSSMGRYFQTNHTCFALMDLLYQAVSEISRHHKLSEFTGSGSWDSQLPYGKLYHLSLIAVINSHHRFFSICKSSVADLLIIIGQKLYRASQQLIIFFMDSDHIPMEADQLLILSSPGIGPSVIRIRKAAKPCLVSIVNGGGSRPGHLDHYRFPKDFLLVPPYGWSW